MTGLDAPFISDFALDCHMAPEAETFLMNSPTKEIESDCDYI